jgi:uncharacterized damage-inducible protein DinB
MSDAPLLEFMRYNNWANQQVLAACQQLSEEQLAAAAPGAYGTIRATLQHIIRAESRYAFRFTGTTLEPPFKWDDLPSLDLLAAYHAQVSAALLEIAARLSPDHLITVEWDGKPVRFQALALFIQVINHGIEHRTNITTILSGLGLPAPDVAGWDYLDTHKERFAFGDAA